jgi:hypothetical protein
MYAIAKVDKATRKYCGIVMDSFRNPIQNSLLYVVVVVVVVAVVVVAVVVVALVYMSIL